MTMDDGCDTVSRIHSTRPNQVSEILAGTEETTTGVIRLRAMEAEGALKYPIVAVNDADTKHMFDNRYGTGQSTLDGVIRATNVLLAGKRVVVAGYGYCGKGVASRARGHGAQVIVTEINPLRALEAVMDGFRVEPMEVAAAEGDIFITVTGQPRRLAGRALRADAGRCHRGQLGPLRHRDRPDQPRARCPRASAVTCAPWSRSSRCGASTSSSSPRDGSSTSSAAEGHPAAVMDMSFANQALAAEWVMANAATLEKRVYDVPRTIDAEIARLKLETMGVAIDRLTPAQEEYLGSWQTGT